jgi:branched-chain amino acid transport system permease protein
MTYIQLLIDGILLGGLYAVMAMGFSVIWGVMNIINLAHGSMIIMGAYITYWLWKDTGIDPFLTLPISAFAMFCFGFFLQKWLLNRVVAASVFLSLILTFGLDMVLRNLHVHFFEVDPRSVETSYSSESLHIGSIHIAYTRLAVFGMALLLTALLLGVMNRTKVGNSIKATSFDIEAASLVGMNTHRVYSITFGIGAALAGMAGSLISVVQAFQPEYSIPYTTTAFVVVILGGLGSIVGALAGGIVLGVAEDFTSYWKPGYKELVSFGLLLAVLLVRRRGLLGKRFYAEI